MSNAFNGNGKANGHGPADLFRQVQTKTEKPRVSEPSNSIKESQVTFLTADGAERQGTVVQVTRHTVVFELYNPSVTPRISETLGRLAISLQGQAVYSGEATVRNIIDAGTKTIYEVMLRESGWTHLSLNILSQCNGDFSIDFDYFFKDWQKFHQISSAFKVVIADLQAFLNDLRLWLERVELKICVQPEQLHFKLKQEAIDKLAPPIIEAIDVFINQFETIANTLEEEAHPSHYAHLRRQLHPLLLLSPFAHRAFQKPLGYAGDYLMVDMMIRPPVEGDTLFAKIINVWLLGQSPAQAHRNRVSHLERKLIEETVRVRANGRVAKIFNLGCGPAAEVQRFFAEQNICGHADLTLVDFSDETLQYLNQKLSNIIRHHSRPAKFRLVKKSANQILKDAIRGLRHSPEEKFDYIYCAGLFDYLSDNVCKQLMNVFYEMLAPGGLLLATNATDVMNSSRPFRYSMEYILDWHLIYRNRDQFAALAPNRADEDLVKVIVESTGTNLFLEIKKPINA